MKTSMFWLFMLLLMGTTPLAAQDVPDFSDPLFRDHGLVMLLIDPATGVIVDANNTAATYYGYTVEQLKQMRIQQINTLSRAEVDMEMQRAETEKRNFFVFRHRLADGSIHPVEVYSSPIIINDKHLLYSVIIDVSQRETLLETVAENESRMRYAEQVASFGHWHLDLTTGQYRFSEGAMRVLGLDNDTYPDDVIRQMILPQDRERVNDILQARIAEGKPLSIVFRFQRPDGTIIDLDSQARYDETSQQIFGTIKDITAEQASLRALKSRTLQFYFVLGLAVLGQLGVILLLVNANLRRQKTEFQLRDREKSLQESNEMIHLLLDSTSEGILGMDKQGDCTFCNKASLKLLGYDQPEQLLGNRIHDLIHYQQDNGTPRPAEHCPLLQGMGQHIHADDDVFWRADGNSFPVEYWSSPIRRSGQVVGTVISFIDISTRKRAEAEAHLKNQELEQFVHIVSHDLKSPLVTISSFLEVLQQDIADNNAERIEKDLSFVRGGVDKMDQLLSALLQLSRTGRNEAKPQRISLQSLFNSTMAAVAGPVRENGIDVVIEPHDLQLYGDPLQLGQIWQNLIENAIKYRGDQPEPRIIVGVDLSTKQPEFFVCDNGIGIAPKHSDRIFDIFAQLNPNSDGCGLGLALVKKIVEHHQGSIRVESEGLGKGSCFYFTLPGALVNKDTTT